MHTTVQEQNRSDHDNDFSSRHRTDRQSWSWAGNGFPVLENYFFNFRNVLDLHWEETWTSEEKGNRQTHSRVSSSC